MLRFSADSRVAEAEMRAVLFVLVAFAHIDGSVHVNERGFIQAMIDDAVDARARESFPGDAAAQAGAIPLWRRHFYTAVASMEHEIQADFSESVAAGETAYSFVYARLKLRCFELLQRLEQQNRLAVLGLVDQLMFADGVVHPAERAFRDELFDLLEEEPTLVASKSPASTRTSFLLDEARTLAPHIPDHPFFSGLEHAYGTDPDTFARQAAIDLDVIARAEAELARQRAAGRGRLEGARQFRDLDGEEPLLDGYVHVHPPRPGVDYDLCVVGDLHGCYSCLKAALLQADFLAKVDAYRADPARTAYPLLVLLGDYIDRGYHSYDGVLRTVLRLLVAAPAHVVVLRGNHEHYMDREGRLSSPVRPAEAIDSIASVAPRELLVAHMRLFEALPSMLVFGRTLFVHAGIPRDDTIGEKWRGLASLNDPEIRLQMAWSDPSDADFVPASLQRVSTRFPFGRLQFRRFMASIGCTTMVRGHERVVEGVRRIYGEPDAMLLSLFSAGGRTNEDLPEESNYREVTPMALSIRHRDGASRVIPFPIDYERWNDPAYNGFLRNRLEARDAYELRFARDQEMRAASTSSRPPGSMPV
jgi:hypothetical protein